MSRTFQISRDLDELTVLENLVVQSRAGRWRDLLRPGITAAEREQAMELLEFRRHRPAGLRAGAQPVLRPEEAHGFRRAA